MKIFGVNLEKVWLLFIFVLAISLVISINFWFPIRDQKFIYLGRSFATGHLYFIEKPGTWDDTTLYNGKHYWPLGPVPAIIITPFFIIGLNFITQGYISFFLTLLNLYLIYKISLHFVNKQIDASWLSFGYIFGTAYLPIALFTGYSYFAHTIATTLLFLSLYCWLNKYSWYWIGLFIALALATRNTLIFASIFFIGNIFYKYKLSKQFVFSLIKFSVPIIITSFLLGIYNLYRFNNFFDSGYSTQISVHKELVANRNMGLWSLRHIPANLFFFLVKTVDPIFIPNTKILTFPYLRFDQWGASIFLTSPIFLWLFKIRRPNTETVLALLTAGIILFSIFGYYGIGYIQFGYRYALDAYPFLFLALLMIIKKNVTRTMKVVILLSFILNIYLISSTIS